MTEEWTVLYACRCFNDMSETMIYEMGWISVKDSYVLYVISLSSSAIYILRDIITCH